MSQSHFRKWTNRLIDEFSSREQSKQLNSTGDSFRRPASHGDSCQSYKEMPSVYKRYTDSLDIKRQSYQRVQENSSFQNIAKMDFVQYRHQPHRDTCAQECTLKKKTKRMCRCQEQKHMEWCHKRCEPQRVVVIEKPPVVIREIQTVVVPSPPTIIREFNHSVQTVRQPQIVREVIPRVIDTVNMINRASVERREVVQSRPHSGSKISFNYVSPAKPALTQSILIPYQGTPQIRVQSPSPPPFQTQVQANSPYKMLQSSSRQEQTPRIIISQPIASEIKQQPLTESLFSFEDEGKGYRDSRQRRKIFPPRESQTAHFIQIDQNFRSNRTNMSESFKIFNGDREIPNSSLLYNKYIRDPIKE